MNYKTIVVHCDASPKLSQRLEVAVELAQRFSAYLAGVHVQVPIAWKAVHTRFSRWAKSRVWRKMFELLAADADNEYAMIDSTIVRAHQHSAGAQASGPVDGH